MLKLLLDEHISPGVAAGLRRRSPGLKVHSLVEWEGGNFLGQEDAVCLQEAAFQGLTFVTYDRRTIPPLLKQWTEEEHSHAGVIFVDEKTISRADIGALVKALEMLAKQTRSWNWTDRIAFLRR
jgi:hypothetical protein